MIISWRVPSNLISGKPVSQYALYSLIFSPLRSIINREQHEKYPYNIFREQYFLVELHSN